MLEVVDFPSNLLLVISLAPAKYNGVILAGSRYTLCDESMSANLEMLPKSALALCSQIR